MTSRDDFIAQLIAALQENETATTDASSTSGSADQESASLFAQGNRATANGSKTSQDVLARQAYEALQFDFPEVHDAQVAALASTYRSITERRVALADARQFPLTTKMLEGIEFLNDSVNKNRGTESSGLLAAALLILIPRFCVVSPDDAVSAALLRRLQASPPRPPLATPAEQQARMEQYAHANATTAAQEEEQFSGGFVEVYAAEEDPDDLSLVYEGSVSSSTHAIAPKPTSHLADSRSATPHRSGQLAELASKTYSTCFSMISSDKWIEWRLDEALCTLSQRLLETESADEQDESQRVFGMQGEWQRYLFVLRDQLLRFSDASDACAGGLASLKALLVDNQSPEPTTKAQTSDPFFSFTKASNGNVQAPRERTTRRVRIAFRVFAELAVSKEFNSLKARKSQHALAATIQQLFPTILRELQTLSTRVSQSSFEADHSDFVIVLLQLLHFVVDAAGGTAASHQGIVNKLQDSGLLRAWLAFLPPVDASSHDWPWLVPLLRLLGECALWNSEFAAFVHRVPKVTKILEATQEEVRHGLSCECVLLLVAAHQQNVPLTKSSPVALWTWFTSERLFPSTCLSFVESMEKMSNAVFLLDALAKAMPTLRPPVANELRANLQSIYNSRFVIAFQYPTFTIPTTSTDTIESLNKDEPELPPSRVDERAEEEKHDDEEERGRAEALQFLALRNRLRQCAKTILLSRMAGFSSSKLD